METMKIIAIVVIAVVAILYIAWKIYKNGLRQTAIDFIVEAEKLYDNGGAKKTFVIENLQKALPFPFSIIISEKVNQSAFVVVYVSERGCRELDRSIH